MVQVVATEIGWVINVVTTIATVGGSIATLAYWLGKKFTRIEQKLEEHDKRLEAIEKKLVEHDKRFEAIEKKLEEHDRRFEEIERKLLEHDKRFEAIEAKLLEHDKRFESIERKLLECDKRFESIERKLGDHDRLLAKHDERLGAIEKELREHREILESMNRRLERVESRLVRMVEAFTSYHEFFVEYLASEGAIPSKSRDVLLAEVRGLSRLVLANPLTKEEWEKIFRYIEKDPETFTLEEANEFLELARKVVREYGEYREAWKLHLYAAMVKGWTLRRIYEEEGRRTGYYRVVTDRVP